MTNTEKLRYAYSLLRKFFKEDSNKIYLWWNTENPLLGGVTPLFMNDVGKIDKVIEFIETSLDENKRSK